ncbi:MULTISPECIES: hypothetical protein [unclassified Leuconostoc]|uniref:hypothetical protein n=1 Tax=unclassified Leuconostoc TaxID=2685106 RepID=UPI00190648A4|nr:MULTISPECIES: hypothetical protein [unclassified Leuconostoc]MBK0041365.1 hypothetical protein [Leuconostoc sp. S51]MBK0052271.1 hypothetical protein [Leuconostoc sp. S50]
MQITGERALANIADAAFYNKSITVEDGQTVPIDALMSELAQHVTDENFMQVTLNINGGIESDGTTLSLETNVINLPLRYQNQLRKMILPDSESLGVNLYMIAENPFVSQSKLKIALVSSVATYEDDTDSAQAKIASWFDEQLAHIVSEQASAETKAQANIEI